MDSIHALIIDDDANNLQVLAKILETMGITYTAVQNPLNTEAAIQNLERLDIVLLDLEMPKLNGYEMFEILRDILGAEIPIVACTVHANEIKNARNLGFDSFLTKPLKLKQFPVQLERILNGEQIWEAQ